MHKLILDNLLLINHSNTSRYDSCGMLSIPQLSYRDVNTHT